MSAFLCSNKHIDAIVEVAIFGPAPCAGSTYFPPMFWSKRLTHMDVDSLGQALLAENIASMEARYPGRHGITIKAEDYRYSLKLQLGTRPALDAIKLIRCYEYQSCEHLGWDAAGNAVRILCEDLERALVPCIPGYDAAPWDI